MDIQQIKDAINAIDECYYDAPKPDANVIELWGQIRELVGISQGLLVAVEALVAASRTTTDKS